MDEKDIIASNITYYRKKLGLSQLELAEKIKYSNKNISKWEKGETTPSVFTLKRLAEIFGITVDDLVSHSYAELSKTEQPTPGNNESQPTDGLLNKKSKLPLSIKVMYLLLAEAIILVGTWIAIIVLGLLDVNRFNKWLLLLYMLPLMCIGIFVFIACVKKRVDVVSLSLSGWLIALSFFVTFSQSKNIHLVFFLMGAIQLLIICIMLLINMNIIRRIKNKLTKK